MNRHRKMESRARQTLSIRHKRPGDTGLGQRTQSHSAHRPNDHTRVSPEKATKTKSMQEAGEGQIEATLGKTQECMYMRVTRQQREGQTILRRFKAGHAGNLIR